MALSGIHAYISIVLKNKLPYKKWFFSSFLFGSILPDIDYLFSNLHLLITVPDFLSILNKTFAHSIISAILIYLLLLIAYEWNKKNKYLNVANGLLLGMLLHITIDLLIWNNTIDLFWPLPIDSIRLLNIDFFEKFYIPIIVLELLFLRIFASFAINSILEYPGRNSYFIKHLNRWTKVLLYVFIIFPISHYLIPIKDTQILYFIIYIPCFFMMLYTIYLLNDSIDYIKKDIKEEKAGNYDRTNTTINLD